MAALLAGTMMLGMSVHTFAAEKNTVSVTSMDAASTVKKTWNVAENGLFNDSEEFTFTLSYKNADPVGTNKIVPPKLENNDFSSKQVILTTTWKTNANGGKSASTQIGYEKLFENIVFCAPGVYHFELIEEAGNNPNIVYSKAIYYIDVQVVWDNVDEGTLKIGKIVTKNDHQDASDAERKVPDADFVNDATKNSELAISKTVAGNAANKQDEFTFTILLDSNTAFGTYSTDRDKVTVTAGQETTFKLRHGEKIIIHNIPIDAKYTVTETDAKGYKKTEVVVNSGEKEVKKVAESVIKEGSNTVAYTNTDDAIAPTGIMLSYVPSILLFAIAVIACFLFFRRTRE